MAVLLKRIKIQQLTLGMFIQELCGSWLNHPFWKSRFLLEDPEDLKKLLHSGMTELLIDTSRGLDVASAPVNTPKSTTPPPTPPPPTPPPAKTSSTFDRIPLQRELQKAAKLCAQSKAAVTSMFNEARMGNAISTEAALPLVEEITMSVTRNPSALISIARLKTKDDYTYMHSVAVCALMVALAQQLKLSEEETRQAGLGGLLHDMGKALIPNEILNKPGKLTDEEFNTVKLHPVKGYELLLEGGNVGKIPLDICLHHHEKVDGRGYPNNLKGEEISLYARMGAICDVYDAITSNRPYKSGWDPAESISKMSEWCNGHFDERIFQAFVRSIGIYPIGSLVRLESGKLGIVTDVNPASLLKPKLKIFFSTKTKSQILPVELDLGKPHCEDRIVGRELASDWGFKNLDELWSKQ
jgi:HD-GYP domain-containing protein (c-di-GMP phosphodiesterase class II)